MLIGGREFDVENNMYIMGILNVTPDSFSDGGRYNSMDAALFHTEEMIRDGADIIDVGGESTRPGHIAISEEEEIERVTPFIEKIKERFDIPVSIDTYKARVAREAVRSGADLINDIWGLKFDPDMAGLVAKYQLPCCLMHNRKEAVYDNFVQDVLSDLRECIQIAKNAGIKDDNIILDCGVGFGKTYEQNLIIINNLEKIKELGYPVLLGTSKKSVIGLTLDVPSDDRVIGTAVTTVVGVQKGCAFYRVHNCRENKQAILMARAIFNS